MHPFAYTTGGQILIECVQGVSDVNSALRVRAVYQIVQILMKCFTGSVSLFIAGGDKCIVYILVKISE